MRQRGGFVSNSSSSSFILFLDHKPKDADDVMQQLYPIEDNEHYHIKCDYYDDTVLHAPEAAKLIFDQIKVNEEYYGKKGKGGYRNKTKVEAIGSSIHMAFYYIDRGLLGIDSPECGREFITYINKQDMDELTEASLERDTLWEEYCKLLYSYRDKFKAQLKEGKPEKFEPKWEDVEKLVNKEPSVIKAQEAEKSAAEKFTKLCNKCAKKYYAKWIKEGKWIGIVTFGDESGSVGGVMEHGNAFHHVKHIKINGH